MPQVAAGQVARLVLTDELPVHGVGPAADGRGPAEIHAGQLIARFVGGRDALVAHVVLAEQQVEQAAEGLGPAIAALQKRDLVGQTQAIDPRPSVLVLLLRNRCCRYVAAVLCGGMNGEAAPTCTDFYDPIRLERDSISGKYGQASPQRLPPVRLMHWQRRRLNTSSACRARVCRNRCQGRSARAIFRRLPRRVFLFIQ